MPTPRHEWSEITQETAPDETNNAMDTPRAGEDAQSNGGKTELNPGNWTPVEDKQRDEGSIGPGNIADPTDTVYEAPVIATINELVATRMGPPARTKQTRKVPAAPGEHKGKQVRFAWEEGLDIIRMYGTLELAKRKVNLQRSPPEGHGPSIQRDDATGVRRGQQGGKEEEKGQMADDAQELLVLIQPRLLLFVPRRTPGNNTKVRTHAEALQETAQLRQQAAKLVGERIALAQAENFAELLRRDELEANALKSRLAKSGEA